MNNVRQNFVKKDFFKYKIVQKNILVYVDNFSLTTKLYNKISEQESFQAAFFDLNEDGVLDIFLNMENNEKVAIKPLYNYLKDDNYFIKALGNNLKNHNLALNGKCTGIECQSALYYGASFECLVSTSDTEKRIAKAF